MSEGRSAVDPPLHCGVLGPLLAAVDGEAVRLGAAKQRALLASLALGAGAPVPYHRLMDCVWGQEPPASARTTLHSYVRRLRLRLDSQRTHFIRSVPGGYRLDVRTVQLDLLRFRELTAEAAERAKSGDVPGEAERLRGALALWRGPVLADVASETLHREDVPRLTEERLGAHERRIDAELRLGRLCGVVAELRELTAEHPLRERFWAQLVIALHGSGRTAEALAAYRFARQRLVEELGLDPGEQLRRLESAILRGQTGPDMVSEAVGPVIAETTSVVAPVPAAPPMIPRRLPPGIGVVVGRDEEIGILRETLRPAPGAGATVPIALVTGRAGVGTSALAVHAAHLVAEDFPDGQLYIDLRMCGTDPGRVLVRLLRSLGVKRERIPDDLDERTGTYRDIVSGRRILVVLDNAMDEPQVRPLLPGTSSCAVLVTSQARLGGLDTARLLELDVLAPREAVELLRRVLGPERVAGERAAANEIVRLCGGLPLAVRIAAARLVTKPHWRLADMAARLRDESGRLDELVHGGLEVRARLAHGYGGLDDPAKTMFRRVGLLKAPEFGIRSAAGVTGMNEADAEAALERLVDARLVDARLVDAACPSASGETRYRLPDLVRLFAYERAS
ncbi:BTAD domain-containing putative transcriptional regulator [Actinomadura sp. 6N118]|uniref:AfsR/SARP family transcriptional regulator n=1 Tax=Actinomadura sp. 6N118 TaxID=3375151 RepID=UPI003797DC40